MRVIRTLDDPDIPRKTALTIGTYDGVHAGHRVILKQVQDEARRIGAESALLTFWPHPRLVLGKDAEDLKLLNTIDEKINLLKQTGLDNLVILPFTEEFSRLSAYQFIKHILVESLRADSVIIGYDHRFGRDREGSLDALQRYRDEFAYSVTQTSAQAVDGAKVSSTKIRNALTEGDVRRAARFLTKPYGLTGKVVAGDQLGRTIGFPTANLYIRQPYKLIPADGVYAVRIRLDDRHHHGMLNIGTRPTVNARQNRRTLEVHIFDFNRMIYGKTLVVSLICRLRDERRFDNTDALREQLRRDAEHARRILA